MSRIEKFESLGNNCRLKGMNVHLAQGVLDRYAMHIEESDAFWEGFFYGSNPEVVSVTELPEVLL